MPSIPLPFVISIMLGLVLIRAIRDGQRTGILFPALIAMFAFQACLSGLNWNLQWYAARLAQPVIAAILPALCYVAFDELRLDRRATAIDILPHLVPTILTTVLVAVWRWPIDIVLFVTYLGYGLALLWIVRAGPDALATVRIADQWTARKALIGVAAMLIATSVIDATISLDFYLGDSEQGRTVLAVASVLWLVIAGYAATVADSTRPDDATDRCVKNQDPTSSAILNSSDNIAIAERLDRVMREQHLYRDPDLTLERLARRSGIPARQISQALNRIHGRNVSQIVNEYRVSDAARRLLATQDQITTIMLEAGFGTKSNFNREFLRVTGMTPSRYRSDGGQTSALPDVSQATAAQ